MQTPEQILSTHDERIVISNPEGMLHRVYKHVAASTSLLSDLYRANVGNINRANTLALLDSCRKALTAAQGLDEWRKKNPHPDDPRYV